MAYELVARLKLVDQLSAPLKRVTSNVNMTKKAANDTDSAFKKFGSTGVSALNRMNTGVGTLVKGFAALKTAQLVTKGVTSSFNKALDFEAELSTIKALTGASAAEMTDMSNLALKMGADTKYNALEAAQGIEELLKAGLTPATVQAGGLEAALNLATAGGLDLAEAAETMSTSLNAFKKDGLTAAQTSDILAGTANASATGVRDIAYGLAQVGSVADMVGLSFKDVNTAIGLMANDGLKSGSDAGTSFKSMLMYLQPQTDKAAKMFNKLGIGVGKTNKFFSNGKIKDIAEIAQVLNDTFKNMSEQARTDTMLEMFGTDGVKAATTLFKAGADGVKEFYSEMSNVTALQVAKQKMDTGRGAIEQFHGAIETLQIKALQSLMPTVKTAFTKMGDFVEQKTPAIVSKVESMVDSAKNYLKTHFTENDEFKKLTSVESKVSFVIDDVSKTFMKLVEENAGPIMDAGAKVGRMVGKSVIDGLEDTFKDHPFLSGLAVGAATPGSIPMKATTATGTAAFSNMWRSLENYREFFKTGRLVKYSVRELEKKEESSGTDKPDGSHAGGLSRVPYNGYVARLHKDERVLPASEATESRSSNGGNYGRGTVTVTGNTFVVRQESDINAIADAIARKLNAMPVGVGAN